MEHGGANAESIAAAEIPRFTGGDVVVDDVGTADGSKRGGIIIERAVEELPG